MNFQVMFTGRGTSGSWQIRGVQLAEALGPAAWAEPMAPRTDLAAIVVGVKRIPSELLFRLRGVPLVWDVVDAWPQPHGNEWDENLCRRWFEGEFERLKPAGIIAATRRMAQDVAGYGVPVLWLPHHHRPKIKPNPIRDQVRAVGYEGATDYIAKWRPAIERECERIGARFVVNPQHLADVDVVLALRGSTGYAARNWKSGVKLANAHGSGTPWIGGREAGYVETGTGCEYWADSPEELRIALDWLQDKSAREQIADRFRAAAFPVEKAARKLEEFLCALKFS